MKYLVWVLLIFLIIFRYFSAKPNFTNGQRLKVSGTILSEPSTSRSNSYFNLANIKVTAKGDNVHYGDYIVIEGTYEDGELKDTIIDNINPSNNFFIKIRKKLVNFYEESLPQPHASLIEGMTIGAKSNLPYNFNNNLKRTGTSHVVVASGTNVTMTAGFLLAILLTVLPRRKALIFTVIFIWIYTLISGFEAPIIRASIMATVAFTGLIFGKVGNSFRYIIFAAIIMLIVIPSWVSDIGFLLSFATTASLILFQSHIGKLFKSLPGIIKEDLTTSISAQIGSTPIIFYFFGNLNLLSPFINVLVLWTIAPIMIIGGLSGILSFFFPALAKIILQFSYPLTAWFVSVVNFFSKF